MVYLQDQQRGALATKGQVKGVPLSPVGDALAGLSIHQDGGGVGQCVGPDVGVGDEGVVGG